MLPEPTLNSYLLLAAVLFVIGTAGLFLRRNLVSLLVSLQVMVGGAGLTFVAADRYFGRLDGQVVVLLILVAALAQLAVGVAIAVALFRQGRSLDPDELTGPRW